MGTCRMKQSWDVVACEMDSSSAVKEDGCCEVLESRAS